MASRNKQYRLSNWTLIEVSRKIKANYFKDLRAYARYRILKREAPYICLNNLARKVIGKMRIQGLKQQKDRALQGYIRAQSTQHQSAQIFKFWRFAFYQNNVLAQKYNDWNLNKKRKSFIGLRAYSISKTEQRFEDCKKKQILEMLRKK